MVQKLHG
jgi:hypothetical protein